MILLNGEEIKPTIFPDKTSQIWKLPKKVLNDSRIEVIWYFENESELFHICQISDLLYVLRKSHFLAMIYLPIKEHFLDTINILELLLLLVKK